MTFIEFPNFYQLLPSFTTVNRKFLITDFRLLSTFVKPENFIEFYRSQKKMKHPRCLLTIIENMLKSVTDKHSSLFKQTISGEKRFLFEIAVYE